MKLSYGVTYHHVLYIGSDSGSAVVYGRGTEDGVAVIVNEGYGAFIEGSFITSLYLQVSGHAGEIDLLAVHTDPFIKDITIL